MVNNSDKNTGFSPKKRKTSKAEVIHTINVKQANNKLKNTVHTVKKENGNDSGKLYGLNVTLYNKGRSISGEVGLIDSGSGHSLMGIDKYWELNRKSKIELEESNVKLVSVTDDEIEIIGAARLGVGIMGVQKEILFTIVNDTIKFAGSMLFGTNLFKEFPILFDFKGGNVLMIEKEEDIYDHTVMPLIDLNEKSNAQISKKSSGNKVPKHETEVVIKEEESIKDDSDIQLEVIEEKVTFPTHGSIEKELSLKRFEVAEVTDKKDEDCRIHSITLGSTDTKFQKEIKRENLIESEKSKYFLKMPENIRMEPNTKRFLEVDIESEAGTKPPNYLNVLVHKNSEFIESGELLIANSISTVREGKVMINVMNISNSNINLFKGEALTRAAVLHETNSEYEASIASVSESKHLSDEEIRNAYKDVLMAQQKCEDSTQVLNNPRELENILDFLVANRQAIALSNDAVDICDLHKYKINLKNDSPEVIYRHPYPLSYNNQKVLKDWVEDSLRKNYIEPSMSVHNSPLVITKKRIDLHRVCVDLRMLNKHIIPERWAIPPISQVVQNLNEMKVFSTLDLLSGFYHIEVDPRSRDYLSFATPTGSYRLTRLAMGMQPSSAVFSKVMNMAIGHLLGTEALIFIDDILVFSKDIKSHYENLGKVMDAMKKHKLKVKLSKCRFFRQSVSCLGYQISSSGVAPYHEKIKAIKQLPPPTDVKGVRSVLGLFNYFRHMVVNYAATVKPMTQLLKKNTEFVWLPEHQKSFEEIRDFICKAPCLKFPNYKKGFT